METPGEQETVAFRNDVAESDRQKKIAESLGPAEKDRRKSHSNNNKQSGQVASVGQRLNGWGRSGRVHLDHRLRSRCAQRERFDSCGTSKLT